MKKVALFGVLVFGLLLGWCSFFPSQKDGDTNLPSRPEGEIIWDKTQHDFIVPGYITSEFSEYLQKLAPAQLPEDAEKVSFGDNLITQVEVYKVRASDFSDFEGNMHVFHNRKLDTTSSREEIEKHFFWYNGYPITAFQSIQFYFIFDNEKASAFFFSSSYYLDNFMKFWEINSRGFNDFFINIPYEFITPEEDFENILYQNFIPVAITKTDVIKPDVDIAIPAISDWIVDKNDNLYIKFVENRWGYMDIIISSWIEKNWKKLISSVDLKQKTFVDIYEMSAEDELLYGVYTSDDDFDTYTYSVILGDTVMYTRNNIRKEDGLYAGDFDGTHYIYSAQILENNLVSIEENAYSGIGGDNEPRSLWKVKSISEQQKKVIENYYALLDKQHFDEAYTFLESWTLSKEAFTQEWEKYSLIDVEYIIVDKIAFAYYWDDNWLEKVSNENLFKVQLFAQENNGKILRRTEIVRVENMGKIEIIQGQSENMLESECENESLISLYFHLLNRKKFEEAHKLQSSASPSVERLEEMYGDAEKIAVRYVGICQLELADNSAEMNWETYEKDLTTNIFRSLVEIVDEKGSSFYYANRRIQNGKISVISSNEVHHDFSKLGHFIHCGDGLGKPVIYLYPEEEMDVKVHLPLKGQFLVTYPQISEDNTWEVIAQPDGTLKNKADWLEYSYLFREGIGSERFSLEEWFVVKREDTVKFLQEKLAYLGLTPREYNEFIVYRRPLMMKNEWNLISFLEEEYTSQAPLFVTPKPDSMQRVFMVFKGLEEEIAVKEQVLKPFERSGFSVIERGGSEIL